MNPPNKSLLPRFKRQLALAALLVATLLPAAGADSFKPTVLVLGDSLSVEQEWFRGTSWVQILRERLQQQPAYQHVRVVNLSQGGMTITAMTASIPQLIEQQQADIVVLALGTNDAAMSLFTAKQWTSALDRAMQKIGDSNAKGILVGTQLTKTLQRRSKVGDRLPSLYQQLAENYSWPIVHWSLAELSAQPGGLRLDGVHPSAKSQPQLANAVWPALHETLRLLKEQQLAQVQ